MGNPNKENLLRGALGVAATAAIFLASGGTGSAIQTVIQSIGGELAGEQASHFLQKAYRRISSNPKLTDPLVTAVEKALKKAGEAFAQQWTTHNPTVDKEEAKNTKAFLSLFTETAATTLEQQFFSAQQADAIFKLIETDTTIGQLTMEQAISSQQFSEFFKQSYQLSDSFISFFTTNFYPLFNTHLNAIITAGGPAKNAVDLLYYQYFNEQLTTILSNINTTQEKLDWLANTITQQGAPLLQQGGDIIKQVLREQQDILLEYINKQPPVVCYGPGHGNN